METPNLQQLSEEGVLFRNVFCANPTCSPSRACLQTGMYANNNGMMGLAHLGWRLTDYNKTIINQLNIHEYETVLASFQHITQLDKKDELGFKKDLADDEGSTEDKAAEYIKSMADSDTPFYLDVAFQETHREFPDSTGIINPDHCLPAAPFPDTAETRKDMADFKLMAKELDRKMGVVFQAVKDAGIEDKTLILATTDHGIAFPKMKCNLTDHGIGVFLIMKGPGVFSGGKCCDALISQIDILPTIFDYVGLQRPNWVDGHSFLKSIDNDKKLHRDQIYAELNFHVSEEPQRCVRSQRYKYIRRYDGRNHSVLPNCDDSISKDFLLEKADWRQFNFDVEQFYDLFHDPYETNNIIDNDAYQTLIADHREQLDRWMQANHDPLLSGPLKKVSGITLMDVNGLSPSTGERIVYE
ncbi:MAG: sulfatase [Lentisphaeria bacterium]|nr:sulfatase [Lentisphaeria bacterium]